jgi:hypothetical protein
MEPIEFYDDLIQDLINLKKIPNMDTFYDKLEDLLKEGNEIVLLSSSFEPDTQYRVKFSSLDSFIDWRKKMDQKRKRLIELFTPKN